MATFSSTAKDEFLILLMTKEGSQIKEILSDLRSVITCAICQEQLTNPRLLPCQHSFCLSCLGMLINSQSGDAQASNPLTCPSCRQMTFLTPGWISMLPVDIKANQIAEIIQTHQDRMEGNNVTARSSNTNTLNVFDITDSDSDLSSESPVGQTAELLWCETFAEHIWDIDFMSDSSVLCACSSRIRQLSSLEGCEMHLAFDASLFHSPCSVAISGDTVIIADWCKGNNEGFLTKLNRDNSTKWKSTMKQTQFQPNGVAMTSAGHIILSGNDHIKDVDLLLCYDVADAADAVKWTQTYPSDTLGPYLAVDNNNHIFVSNPMKNTIDLYSMTGQHISEIRAEGVSEPSGLCFSLEHHLVIADQSNRRVSMFDMNGSLIEHLVDFPGLPNSVCLYEDRLLAVTDWQQKKLYMYELHK